MDPLSTPRRFFLVIYALSGTAALLYEVAWTRLLTLHMGHTMAAVATVLAAYMGGMSAGSLAGGWYGARLSRERALRVYAILEILIAAAAVLLPLAIASVRPVLAWAYAGGEGGTWFGLARLVTALLLLAVPTAAMGATFPVATRWAVSDAARAGGEAGGLYAANTVGATTGALAAGFVLLPALGLRLTTLVGFILNLTAAGGALWLRRSSQTTSTGHPAQMSSQQATTRRSKRRRARGTAKTAAGTTRAPLGRPSLAAAAVATSGFVALVYEVTWTRVLALVIGPTSYAFSAMLAAFIGGLAAGSAIGAHFAPRTRRSILWLSGALLLTTAGALGAVPIVNRLPLTIARAAAEPTVSFASMAALQLALATALLLPMTLALGAAFPLAIAVGTRSVESAPRDVAILYASNTAGAIAGALGAGFLLVPLFGLRNTITVAGGLAVAASVILVIAGARRRAMAAASALAAAGALFFALLAPRWDRDLLASGAYKYAPYLSTADIESALKAGTLLYYAEGGAGTVSVKRVAGTLTLAIDGKVDASNGGDMLTQKLLGHLPLLLHPSPRSVCIIGLGSGVTLGAVLRHSIDRAEVIEISREVVRASDFFLAENNKALRDPRTRLIVGDGRSHLMLGGGRYDVIISEPSNPWMSGMAMLFTREFFAEARRRLVPGGLFCQWAHTYDMSDADLRSIVATFTSVFPRSTLWLVGEGDVLLIGGLEPTEPLLAGLSRNFDHTEVATDLAEVSVRDSFSLLSLFAGGEPALRRYAADAPIETDDRLALEYSAPRAIYERSGNENTDRLSQLTSRDEIPAVVRTALENAGAPKWRNRGLMALGAEAHAVAFDDFKKALEIDPRDAAALDGLSRAAAGSRRLEEARALITDLCARDPMNVPARIELSKLLASQGAFRQASSAAQEALDIDPTDPAALEQLASVVADLQDLGRLGPLADRMIRENPERADSHYYAATVRFLQGRFEQAARLAEEAITLDPKHARASSVAGAAYGSLGRVDRARPAFERALAIDPKNPTAYANLGLLEMSVGNLDAAARAFAEALTVDPAYRPAMTALADILAQQGHTARAARLRKSALER